MLDSYVLGSHFHQILGVSPERLEQLQASPQANGPESLETQAFSLQAIQSNLSSPRGPHDPPNNRLDRTASFGDVMEISSASTSSDEGELQDSLQGSFTIQQPQAESDHGQLQTQNTEQQSGRPESQSPGTNESRTKDETDLAEVQSSSVIELKTSSENIDMHSPDHIAEVIKQEGSRTNSIIQTPKPDSRNANKGAVSSAPIVLDEDEDDYEPPESISPASPVDNNVASVDSFSPPPPDTPFKEAPQPVQDSAIPAVSEHAPADNRAEQKIETLQQIETIAPDVQEVSF